MNKERREHFNLNTILIGVLLALGGWGLSKLSDLQTNFAGVNARMDNIEKVADKLDSRVGYVENKLRDDEVANANGQPIGMHGVHN